MSEPYDLRKVLEELKELPGQYHETDIEIDPQAELSGVYRYIGAGGTVKRPTQEGPAMTFNNIKGFPGTRVSIGTMASRKRVGEILHHDYRTLGKLLQQSVEHPVKPVEVTQADAPVQEVIHLASEADFDIRKLLPAPTNTEEDAGPYITMGVVLGSDPEKTMSDVTIHRMVLEDKDTIGMYIMPGGRHIGHFHKQFEALNKPMPITINIGLDPAIAIGTTFEPPTTPLGTMNCGLPVLCAKNRCNWFPESRWMNWPLPGQNLSLKPKFSPMKPCKKISTPILVKPCRNSPVIREMPIPRSTWLKSKP